MAAKQTQYGSDFIGPLPIGATRSNVPQAVLDLPRTGNAPYQFGSNVLGASTGPRSSTPTPSAGPSPAPAQQGPNLDEIFNPAFSTLDESERSARSGYDADVGNLNNRYSSGVSDTNKEQDRMLGDVDKNETDFRKSVESALAQAVQYYNALAQRGRAAYGAFSSAGQALSDIGTQEFTRQQGNINQELTKGLQEFSANRVKIKDYISKKLTDLDNWKNEAMTGLKKSLDSTLASINSQRNQLNSDKAAARLQAIQETMANARSIASADNNYRGQLMQQEIASLENTLGRALTVEERALLANDYGISVANIASEIQGNPGQTITAAQGKRTTAQYQDPYEDLRATPVGPNAYTA